MAPVGQSGTHHTPPANQRMTAAGAEDFFVSPPWLQVSNSLPPSPPLKKFYEILAVLVPRRGFKPYF